MLRHNRRSATHPRTGEQLQFSCPAPDRYPFQWFWDSCFHAVALAHLEPDAARAELRLLVSGQDAAGGIPHVLFWNPRLLIKPALYWCWLQSSGRGLPLCSALIQPPVLAVALERVYAVTGDRALVVELLPALDAYYGWLARSRDVDGSGLLAIIAPWESGMDHRPSYDIALGLQYPAEPRQLILEPRVLDIVNRLHGYDLRRLLRSPRFLVQDVLVNATFVDGLRALAGLHVNTGSDGRAWNALAARAEQAMLRRMRGDDGFFYDRDLRTGRLLPVRTVAGLSALLLDGLSNTDAGPLLRDLRDPARFAAPYALPSVAMDEPAFVAAAQFWRKGPIIWRGPTWLNLNWLVLRALERRGLEADAQTVRRSSLALVQKSGFREYYNPLTGEGYGPASFGWSTLVVDMIADQRL